MSQNEKGNAKALIPILVFLVLYLGLGILFEYVLKIPMGFYNIPIVIVFLIALTVACFQNRALKFDDKLDVMAKGVGDKNIFTMLLIFLAAGAFVGVVGRSSAESVAYFMLSIIPPRFAVAVLFVVACFVSTAMGTSVGTITLITPIAVPVALASGFSMPLCIGSVIGGAMFGDNLSMISDTTIAATRTQGVRMQDKFCANIRIAAPAALVALAIYAVAGSSAGEVGAAVEITFEQVVLIVPYVLVLVLALFGFNVMALLFSGTILSAVLGFAYGKFDFFGSLDLLGKGTLGMSETLIVAILAGGLFRSVQSNGGIAWLTDFIAKLIRGPRTCEFGMAVLVALVNCFTANNTVAIVIAGPIARVCSEKFKADPIRIASVLDTVSCVVQGLIPYGAQILIAVGIAKGMDFAVSPAALIGRLYYQPILALAVLIAMVFAYRRRRLQD